ncbi:JAB domain-containing protein [Lysinibacillus sp. FSL K6-0075]|uniref:JAB domain-containing protein n=1 Tax=Lysinibacillus sp. FSL K6-0075 TaxID=2921415 RepID=UPI0031598CAE
MFEGRRVRSSEDAANIIRDFIGDSDREKFVVLCLSTKNEPTAMQVVHTGSINASIVHPRDVLKLAIISNSASCIVGHNHPSNDTMSSPEDIDVMKRLVTMVNLNHYHQLRFRKK